MIHDNVEHNSSKKRIRSSRSFNHQWLWIETICIDFWIKYEVAVFFFFSGGGVYYGRQWLYLFRQLSKWLANNLFWIGPWQVLPICQYSSPSCPACTHPDSVVCDVQDCAYRQWTLMSLELFRISFVWHVPASSLRWRIIVNIVDSSYLDSTTMFGVLFIQDILSSERIRKTFSLCSWAVVQDSLPYKSVLRTQALYADTSVLIKSWGFFHTRVLSRARVEAVKPIRMSFCRETACNLWWNLSMWTRLPLLIVDSDIRRCGCLF